MFLLACIFLLPLVSGASRALTFLHQVFSSFDDCDTEEHEPNFPPLADHFLGLCIFLWILLAMNLVYFLIEILYYRRNQKEFVYINHFINRGIKSRAALVCEKRLEQKRKDRLEANQGLPEDGLTTA